MDLTPKPLTLFILSLITLNACQWKGEIKNKMQYPDPPKVNTVDTYFGKKVKDPYRWMENLDSDTIEKWVQKENQLFDRYMKRIGLKNAIKDSLTDLWDFPKYSEPFRAGAYQFFYFKNKGLQDQSVLYHLDSTGDEPEVFLDPNKFSKDGTVALTSTTPSKDGKYLAYGISKSGSDWREIYLKNIRTGKKLKDHLTHVKFSGISWVDSGFYYSRYDQKGNDMSDKNKNHKVYFHKIGTDQDKDRLVYHNPDKPFVNYYAQTTEDGKYLLINVTKGAGGNNRLLAKPLKEQTNGFKTIIPHYEHSYSVVGHRKGRLLVLTNDEAPNYRLISINPEKPAKKNWRTLIPQKEDGVLESVSPVGNKLLAHYMKEATSTLRLLSRGGKLIDSVPLPTLGHVSRIEGRKQDSNVFFSFQSFVYPKSIYQYNVYSGQKKVFKKSNPNLEPEHYVTKQVSYRSTDGTEVPMFIVHKKGLRLNGEHPTLLYGYGGFNITLTPEFDISRTYFLKNGGVFAMPNLRGGGVYGESWHKQGMKENKQQVFDDFKQAGQFLFENDYTNKNNLAISGRSNGGLLVGAVMTQNPGMMKVALPAVGVMDMLRYHKFTIGWAWVSEYGSSEDSASFEYLYDYSPYHNLKPKTCYPATLVTTADHDDRVVPAHSFKFTARLQAYQNCDNPTLISIETKAGHGAGKPLSKTIKQQAEKWAFTFYHLGMREEK